MCDLLCLYSPYIDHCAKIASGLPPGDNKHRQSNKTMLFDADLLDQIQDVLILM